MKPLNEIIRSDILAAQAYAVAHTPEGCLKLDAMESPYEFPAESKKALAHILADAPLRLYPNVADDDFTARLKAARALGGNVDIALGNGSDELIQFITLLAAKPGAKVMGIEPTFVMYRRNAALFGMEYLGIDTLPDFALDTAACLKALEEHAPEILFIAYPNNPTGTRYNRADVEKLIAAAPGLVVVDEAYGAFSADSFLPQAGTRDNLLVLQTFSKIGFAGCRMGYVCGSEKVIAQLRKILPPYNMNQLSLAALKFALTQEKWINDNVARLKGEREILFAALEDMEKVQVFPSEGNFLTVRVPDAAECFQAFLAENILIKNLHGVHPLLHNCVRITIGTPADNARVLAVFAGLYAA